MNGSKENGLASGRRHWNTWGQYVAVAAAYEAIYEITYHLSFQQFLLTTGLRLACMLLLPPRYWLALAIGESVPLIENAVFCVENFGVPWAVLASIPTVALWWPFLLHVRRRWPLHDPDGRVRMPVILGATLGIAVITAAVTTATLVAALLHAPGKWPKLSPGTFFVGYLLGAYLGALTLTPVILALRERVRGIHTGSFNLRTVWRSPLLRDTLGWVAPALAAIVWFAASTPDEGLRQLARFALLWPVAGMAWRYGWHGAAVGGMGASFALALTAKGPLDAETLHVQVVLALGLSVTLWITARVLAPGTHLGVPRILE